MLTDWGPLNPKYSLESYKSINHSFRYSVETVVVWRLTVSFILLWFIAGETFEGHSIWYKWALTIWCKWAQAMATSTGLVTSLNLNRSVSLTLNIRYVSLPGQSMLNNKQQLQVALFAWPQILPWFIHLLVQCVQFNKTRNNNNVMSVWFWQ